MKKVILSATLIISVATFAQKEELKTLKKIYAKETISEKDLETYKATSQTLQGLATEEADKVYANFYKGMLPIVEITSLGAKATSADQLRLMTKENLDSFTNATLATIEFEKKTDKKVYTDKINETLAWLKPMLSQTAFQLNGAAKYKEASSLFYSLYVLDKKEGINLENAAQLSLQAQDYITTQKLYQEFLESDYLNNGFLYFAKSKVSGKEENFPNKAYRDKMVSLGSHENSRDEKVSLGKPDVLKTLAEIVAYNGDIEKAKLLYKEAKKYKPEDVDMLINESKLYFQTNDIVNYEILVKDILKKDPNNATLNYNIGYLIIKDDTKIVNEINANTSNIKKYNELVEQRKVVFMKALPYFEKAHQVNATDENIKSALKLTYEIVGQPEKAKALN